MHPTLYGSIMRGSRNFCQGGGGGGGGRGLQAQLTEKKHSDDVFLGISLLQRGPIIYFKENYNF